MATVLSLRTPAGGFNALPERASGWDVAMPDPFELETIVAIRSIPTKPAEYAKQLARILRQNPELTIPGLAARLDKSTKWVERRLQLTRLHEAFARMLDRNQITLAQAEALSQWPAKEQGDHWNEVMALPERRSMNLRLHFKTPDVVDQIKEDLGEMSEDEQVEAKEALAKFIRNGESITIDINTVEQTAKVIPA